MITTSLSSGSQQEPEDVMENFLDIFRESTREKEEMILQNFSVFGVSFEAGEIRGLANIDQWSKVTVDIK